MRGEDADVRIRGADARCGCEVRMRMEVRMPRGVADADGGADVECGFEVRMRSANAEVVLAKCGENIIF